MPNNVAPKAHWNMKKGYALRKEGYVKNIHVTPNVSASKLLFSVKARVSASMKSVSYTVYVHLNQAHEKLNMQSVAVKQVKGGVANMLLHFYTSWADMCTNCATWV